MNSRYTGIQRAPRSMSGHAVFVENDRHGRVEHPACMLGFGKGGSKVPVIPSETARPIPVVFTSPSVLMAVE